MAENQNTDAKDARIAELEAQLAEAQSGSEPVKQEKTVVLRHANGTKVRVGESQVEGLKASGFKK
jgi:hypothetical protein